MTHDTAISGWERVAMGIERVRERLQRTAKTLGEAQIPYAVIGGNAVAEWVGRVDDGAVRFTRDVDILLRRDDLPAAIRAMQAGGFVHHYTMGVGTMGVGTMGVDMFLDGPNAQPSEAVHVIFAGEKVKDHDLQAAPDVLDAQQQGQFFVISLEALVRMKLTSFRRKDQTHLEDMIGVGLIDRSWLNKYQPELSKRLAEIFDFPEGA